MEKKTIKEDKKINTKKVAIGILIIVSIIILFFVFKPKNNVIELEKRAYEIYNWKCEIENKKIVKLSKKKVIGDTKDQNSNELIIEKFYYEPLKKGKTSIKCYFTNINTGSYTEYKEYSVTVDKNLKLSIKQKH